MGAIRQALQTLPAPVALIGAKDGDRHNITTVAWICQESGDPPQVMVSIAPQRFIHDMIVRSREFMVTVMGEGDEEAALFCGTKSGRDVDKVKELGLPTEPAEVIGVPRIKGALANLECRLVDSLVSGDHTIFVGKVVAATFLEGRRPLVWSRGKMGLL
ncbi:FMN reductase-like protein [Thermacetogenium phaeum DSM 12270]|uniref:FMN reductase-like protein n=2 Tax=Thermacetogenium phaeum TaxID=85874 RepID=K4LG91_THEPS|nr:flavin reductase family protein [Thermacetogenium phaeum]AFV12036.1 FMN reductase-like protein [Thermacetogenium phaeum DSM 12270]KUK35922.1 MAG: FMN reductase-like protein [Thermacetogenium phaeum]